MVIGATLATAGLAFFYKKSGNAAESFRHPVASEVVYRRARGASPAKTIAVRAKSSPEEAARVAEGYVRQFRSEGDPRALGRAQAVLAPWWEKEDAPGEVLLLRALIRQANHDFSTALRDLDRLVIIEPGNSEAWLVRATVLTVLARASCAKLRDSASELTSAVCVANIDSRNGRGRSAVSRIGALVSQERRVSEETTWAVSCLAEMEASSGLRAEAERHFLQVLDRAPDDTYTRTAYADFLLGEDRNKEALAAVEHDRDQDALILRHVIAATRLGAPEAPALATTLRERFVAGRLRGDFVHEREEARFVLEVEHDAARAVVLAKHNFSVQKEPADLRVLAEAACACERGGAKVELGDHRRASPDAEASALVTSFLASTQLDDVLVNKAISQCKK